MKDVGVWSLVTGTGFEYMEQLYQQAVEEAFRLAWQTVSGKQFPSTLYIMGMGL